MKTKKINEITTELMVFDSTWLAVEQLSQHYRRLIKSRIVPSTVTLTVTSSEGQKDIRNPSLSLSQV